MHSYSLLSIKSKGEVAESLNIKFYDRTLLFLIEYLTEVLHS